MLATTFKKSAVALAFGLTSLVATSAFAAPTFTITDGEAYFGNNFAASGSYTDVFTFTLAEPTDISGSASSTYLTIGAITFSGFDITSAILSGGSSVETSLVYNFAGGSSTTNTWTFSATNLTAGDYTLTISGIAGLATTSDAKASYGGNLTFTAAIPEPSTYGMLALGLGLVGFAARSRSRKNASKFA
ncbi:FxDxF family PEP-CTERM protein [Methylobacillus arboreus]|uniref:FxDxF family PEP-CTERM protein n=1 Tax=Methylobacillus arboreus TaxID=755170 RepID=UPI001E60BB3D|nr:FxDxF family PEP-CTERM protein [Methylobacillus arboreus]MCB5191823.1 FxDxF family PEP-CTERM protein [Methylobacillus arboreus]